MKCEGEMSGWAAVGGEVDGCEGCEVGGRCEDEVRALSEAGEVPGEGVVSFAITTARREKRD